MTSILEVLQNRHGGYWGTPPGGSETDALAIRNGDVGVSGEVRWASLPTRGFTSREISRASVQVGDIVMTTSGNCGEVAIITALPDRVVCATNFVRVLRVDQSRISARYLFHFMRSPGFKRAIAPHIRGATIKNLSVDAALGAITLPLPPVNAQRRIAELIDQSLRIINLRQQSLERTSELITSLFLNEFGDSNGTVVTVDDVLDSSPSPIRTGPFGSQLLHSEFVGQGVKVLGIDNVVGNEFKEGVARYITVEKYKLLERYTVRPGDVLITIMGTVGRSAVVPDDIGIAINTKHLCCISVDRSMITPGYLHMYFLLHPATHRYLRSVSKGAIMDGLNMGLIRRLPLVLPSIESQQRFDAKADTIRALMSIQRRHLSTAEALHASLADRVFGTEVKLSS